MIYVDFHDAEWHSGVVSTTSLCFLKRSLTSVLEPEEREAARLSTDGLGELRAERIERIDVEDLLRRWSTTASLPLEPVTPLPCGAGIVDWDETDDASDSSLASGNLGERRPPAAVSDLFFLGRGGRTFPGSSVRKRLCRRAKSPYRLLT